MKPSQPFLDFTAAPVAPQRVTMAPTAIEARRSGLRAAREKMPAQLREYLTCLRAIGPASDHEVARVLGLPVSTVNARRADAGRQVEAHGRIMVTHPDGKRSSRTLWKLVSA